MNEPRYRYEDLNTALLRAVPELLPAYERLQAEWDDEDISPHIVFDLVDDFVVDHIDARDTAEYAATLRKIFHFLEEVVVHGDTNACDVVRVTVCERLGFTKELLAKTRSLMGPQTRWLSHDVEVQLRGHDPLGDTEEQRYPDRRGGDRGGHTNPA